MILITARHAGILAALWNLTERGTKKWTGVVKMPGVSQPNVNDCLNRLRRKGAVDWEKSSDANGHCRIFRCLAGPESIAVVPADALKNLKVDRSGKGHRALRDTGAFSNAAAMAKMPRFENDPRGERPELVRRLVPPCPGARAL